MAYVTTTHEPVVTTRTVQLGGATEVTPAGPGGGTTAHAIVG